MTDLTVSDTADTLDAELDAAQQADNDPIPDDFEGGDENAEDPDAGDEDEGEAEAPQPEVNDRLEKAEKARQDVSRALKEERRRGRELEARLAALEGKGKSDAPDPFKAIADIDEDSDPIGAIKAFKDALLKEGESRQATAAQTAQQRQFEQINRQLTSFEADFKADNPDYDEAVVFLRDSKKAEMEEMGYSGDELGQALDRDLLGVVARAMQSGRDPAEVAYALAKKRGFGVEKPKKVDVPDKTLQTIERGQKAARTLGTGSSAGSQVTEQALLKLEGAAFDKAFAQLERQNMRVAQGRR